MTQTSYCIDKDLAWIQSQRSVAMKCIIDESTFTDSDKKDHSLLDDRHNYENNKKVNKFPLDNVCKHEPNKPTLNKHNSGSVILYEDIADNDGPNDQELLKSLIKIECIDVPVYVSSTFNKENTITSQANNSKIQLSNPN